jgi:UDP-N-acetyl-D-glucosamine dehydrogenase
MKVSIIGQGYVGLTISVFAGEHHNVIGFDKNDRVVDALNTGKSHIEGVESADLAKLIAVGKYKATTDAAEIAGSNVVVIAVPTPLTKDRKPDLSFVEAACKTVGENVKSPALIINESTSFPGTVRNLIKPLIEKYSGSIEHMYAVSPERVDPGRSDWNQKNTPRLYAGLTPAASAAVRDFYSTFCGELIEVSSPEVAESAKLFENTFRQVNIALVNEFAQIAHALGISVYETLDAAATKPYGFMKFMPSAGVGGHCIPVDPSYLAHTAAGLGVPATFIERANEVNVEMAKYVVDRVKADNGGSLSGKTVQVVGVAYKPNVADVRETPAEPVIGELKKAGAVVNWSDDVVGNWMGQQSSPLGGADIALVVTLHAVTDAKAVLKSAPYVFDTTGKVAGAHSL